MTDADKELQLITFGCRLNSYESEVMRRHAEDAGLGDAVIFNTCAVTKEAERQARQAIRRARRGNPQAKIIVTGCAAQIDPQRFGAMKEVDHVIGNDLKLEAGTWEGLGRGTGHAEEKIRVNDIMAARETAAHLLDGFEGRARAFVQVQQGCDHRCTFCIIPYGRGNSRSVPVGGIVEQVRALVTAGYNEIVMTGVDITSYGPDLPGGPTLGQMIRRVLALVPELKRLRLSSLDPAAIDEDLWRLIAEEPRLMPHLHLSLQAGDDMILKRMKRRHLRADVIELCRRAHDLRPDMAFGADIIAGFPTETDAMFENTLDLVRECGLTFLHVFPYSPRPGTPAARMPQVPGDVRRERAKRLRNMGMAQMGKFLKNNINKTVYAVAEKENFARSENFAYLRLNVSPPPGALVRAVTKAAGPDYLDAEILA